MNEKRERLIPRLLDAFVVWSLCLFRIFKKSVYVLFECFFVYLRIIVCTLFAVNNRRTAKRHVVVIALAIFINFSSCTAVEAEPRLIEGHLFSFRQMSFELSDSFTKIAKPCSEVIVNVFRPISRDWVNFFQFSMEGVGEFFSGIIENIFIVSIGNEAMSSDNSEENNDKTNGPRYIFAEDIAHAFPLIFLFLVALYIVTQRLKSAARGNTIGKIKKRTSRIRWSDSLSANQPCISPLIFQQTFLLHQVGHIHLQILCKTLFAFQY